MEEEPELLTGQVACRRQCRTRAAVASSSAQQEQDPPSEKSSVESPEKSEGKGPGWGSSCLKRASAGLARHGRVRQNEWGAHLGRGSTGRGHPGFLEGSPSWGADVVRRLGLGAGGGGLCAAAAQKARTRAQGAVGPGRTASASQQPCSELGATSASGHYVPGLRGPLGSQH